MEKKQSDFDDLSSAQAVLVGALAPGVNAPTWTTLKMVFMMLGISLTLMLVLGFTSSDTALILHVGFLVLITLTLFLLLTSFLQQTGLVTVEHQMQEMGLATKDIKTSQKTE
ncbi:Acetylcholine receptor subunit alpha-type unc-38 [Bienertia sinuspersici]